MALQVDVTRRPFSFRGASPPSPDPSASTWAEGLKNYYPAYYEGGEFRTLRRLGTRAGVAFDFDTAFDWHPVDSQRLLLWATTQGKGEELAEAMGRRHFEERKSAIDHVALREAAEEVGLGGGEAARVLASEEFTEQVWQSYAYTVQLGIRSIPLFLFWPPGEECAGPFRGGRPVIGDEYEVEGCVRPKVVRGSADPARFLGIFEEIAHEAGASLA